MVSDIYKQIFVKKATHKVLKLLTVKKGLTFDQLIKQLIKGNHDYKKSFP